MRCLCFTLNRLPLAVQNLGDDVGALRYFMSSRHSCAFHMGSSMMTTSTAPQMSHSLEWSVQPASSKTTLNEMTDQHV